MDFDVEIAIKVCRQGSPEDALLLAQKHQKHEWYLRIQIEDKAEYKKALEYMETLDFEEVIYSNLKLTNLFFSHFYKKNLSNVRTRIISNYFLKKYFKF